MAPTQSAVSLCIECFLICKIRKKDLHPFWLNSCWLGPLGLMNFAGVHLYSERTLLTLPSIFPPATAAVQLHHWRTCDSRLDVVQTVLRSFKIAVHLLHSKWRNKTAGDVNPPVLETKAHQPKSMLYMTPGESNYYLRLILINNSSACQPVNPTAIRVWNLRTPRRPDNAVGISIFQHVYAIVRL